VQKQIQILLHTSALLESCHQAFRDEGTQGVPKHAVDNVSIVCTKLNNRLLKVKTTITFLRRGSKAVGPMS
jgi:hypothetical protein